MDNKAFRYSTGLFLLLAAAFVLGSLFAIGRQAIYIPYWDQWGWLERYALGRESLLSLTFTPINGHVVAVPALLYGIDASLFGASNRVNLAAMIACIAGICLLLRAHLGGLAEAYRGRMADVYFATAAILMLWFHNWENLFWPFQVHQYVATLLSMLALSALAAALAGGSRRAVGACVAGAVVLGLMASASFGAGLGVWGASAVIVSLGRWRPRWRWAAAALALGIGISLGLYLMPFAAYGIPSAERKPGSFEILALLRFLAQFLGSPVVPGGNERVLASVGGSLALAAVAGSVGIALACFVAIRVLWLRSRRSLGEAELFFVGIIVFALSAGVMTAVARGTDGPPWRALSSRYGMFCLLFWLAAVPLAAPEAAAAKAGIRRFAALVPIVVLLLLVPSQLVYLGWWMKWRSMVDGATASLVSGVPDSAYLAYIFPADRLQIVERTAPLLLREGLTPLHEIRARFIGHPVTKFGTPDGMCDARIVETKALSAGYRYSGTLTASGLPFDEQPVFVTDAAGRVIGIGAVDRGWWWGLRGGLADRTRLWVAFAPRDRSGAAPVRIYASVGPRLCALGEEGGRG